MKCLPIFTVLLFSILIFINGCKNKDKTDPIPLIPAVTSTTQQNNPTGVPRDEAIAITFNKPMNNTTITSSTFFLMQGTTLVEGTISFSGNTATFTPNVILAANTTYTATATTGIKDKNGTPLQNNIVWSFTTGANSAPRNTVNLGTSANYVLLAKTAINNSAISNITGDIGLSPAATSYITGFALVDYTGYATSSQITGSVYAADMVTPTSNNLTVAVNDMITAYNDAAGRPTPDFVELGTGDIGGLTLSPGLYKWTSSVTAPTSFTISGGANDVWIFQIDGNLSLASAVNITLAGGAKAENIFWQVAGTVTIGTSAHMEGVILSKTGVTFTTSASLHGRALAQTAVILDANVITTP